MSHLSVKILELLPTFNSERKERKDENVLFAQVELIRLKENIVARLCFQC